jgi:glycosyltransferase involved in cell wall biosynthesis
MNNKLISIIVPVYNAEAFIEECLNSLICQSYENLEILCVNDGSKDNSREILEKYALLDNRIKVINILNNGVSIARNTGIDCSKGDYIMFVDGDDWIDIDTCKIALNKLIETNSDIVMWSYIKEYSNKNSIKKEIFNKETSFSTDKGIKSLHRRFIGMVGEELKNIESADALSTVWGKLYSKKSIGSNRFTDLRDIGTYEDGLFNLYVFESIEKATFICNIFYHYRKYNLTSITYGYKVDLHHKWSNLFEIMNKYIQERVNFLDIQYFEALNNRISLSVIGLGINEVSNSTSIKNQLLAVRKILSDSRINESLAKFPYSNLGLKWRFFFRQVKKKRYFLVFLMLNYMKLSIRK